MKRNSFRIFPFLTLLLISFLIYSNSFKSSFHFDDKNYIIENSSIRKLNNAKAMWHYLGKPTRVVGLFSFALNYYFHQLDVFGYHLINYLIHFFNAIWVYWLMILLWKTPRLKDTIPADKQSLYAMMIALVFVVHPIQTQAVTYISQRLTSLASFFYILTLCLYLKGRLEAQGSRLNKVLYAGALLSALLGMFTKEIVFTLPFMIFLIEKCFFNTEFTAVLKRRKLLWIPILVFLIVIPAQLSFNFSHVFLMYTPSASHDDDFITPFRYSLTQFRVILTYLRLLIFPIGQNLDYDFPLSLSLFEPSTLLCFLSILGLMWLAWKLYAKHLLLSFGIFWMLLTLAVESSIIPIQHVIFEHRVYLPSVGFSIFLTTLLWTLFESQKRMMVSLCLIVMTLGYLTHQRNHVWFDEVSLWKDFVKKSPHKARPYVHLGMAYLKRGQYDVALSITNKALTINPRLPRLYNNRGVIYKERGLYDLALNDFNKAISLKPDYFSLNNRGNIYRIQGQLNLALEDFNEAFRLRPNNADILNNRGIMYSQMNQDMKALDDFNKAIETNPHHDEAYYNRGLIYKNIGQLTMALNDFNQVIQFDPNHFLAYYHRGLSRVKLREFQSALKDLDRVIGINPQFTKAYFKRANIYFLLKDIDGALSDYKSLIEMNPENGLYYYKRSMIYRYNEDYENALEDALTAKSLGESVEIGYIEYLQKHL